MVIKILPLQELHSLAMDLKFGVFNSQGMSVKAQSFSPGNYAIDLSSFSSGMNFLRVNDHVQKFIKD